jgi:hypothetical protein
MWENVGIMTLPTSLPASVPPSPLAWLIDLDHPAEVYAKRWLDANAIPITSLEMLGGGIAARRLRTTSAPARRS